jgi:hypothetical protein
LLLVILLLNFLLMMLLVSDNVVSNLTAHVLPKILIRG